MYDDDEDKNKVEEAALKYLKQMTPEEFLEWEERQEQRYEYVDGEIIPVQAASGNHNLIVPNVCGEIRQFLKGKSCLVYGSQLRISAKSMRSYFYPDVSIFCEKREVIDISGETYKNPTVIFEVLSPSTCDYDMGVKQQYYREIDSLKEYIIIDSRKVEVHIMRRVSNDTWRFEKLESLDDELLIESIGMSIPLNEVYSNVKLSLYSTS